MKTSKKTIELIPRKILRYVMLCKRDGKSVSISKDIYKVTDEQIDSIVPFYEKKKGFANWESFEVLWDIGFGAELIPQKNRPEKWFLIDKAKSEIVKRPKDYWEKEAVRKNTSTHALFEQQSKMEGITMNDFFTKYF